MGLVLSRKPGEDIVIDHAGERITLQYVALDRGNGKIRLRFVAPPSVRILRRELDVAIDRTTRQAAATEGVFGRNVVAGLAAAKAS